MLSGAKMVCLSLVVLLLSAMLSQSICAQSDLSAEDILEGLKYNESLVRDFSCRYQMTKQDFFIYVESTNGKIVLKPLEKDERPTEMGTYFCAEKGPKVRWDREVLNSSGDVTYRDKQAFDGELSTAWQSQYNEGVIAPNNEPLMQNFLEIGHYFLHDVWFRPYSEMGTWKEVQEELRLRKDQEVVGGRLCYVLEEYRRGRLFRTLYVDSERFISVKFCHFFEGPLGYSWEVLEWMELPNGIWFPAKIVLQSYITTPGPYQGQEMVHSNVVVDRESIKVNSGLPDDLFRITFEPGTIIDDRVVGERYVFGGEGLAEEDVDGLIKTPAEVKPPEAGEGATPIPPEKAVEPRELGREPQSTPIAQVAKPAPDIRFLLVGFGVGLVVVGILSILWRRRQKSKAVIRKKSG